MKLAIFGGTGVVGSALLAQALNSGYQVRLLAREPARVSRDDENLTVVRGNAKDPAAVGMTVQGCEAVLSTLGGLADPESIRVGTATVMSAMREAGLRRIVIMQGYHLDFPGDPQNAGRKLILPLLWLGSRSLIGDSRAMATAVQASDLDWTVVRAPRVTKAGPTAAYRTGQLRLGPWNSVTNGDVAGLMLACLTDPATIGTAPMIAR